MILAPHTIKSPKGAKKKSKRVGRGNASGKGTYAGRGLKGQKARSGGRRGLKRRGFKQALQKMPKSRGFKSIRPKAQTVALAALERAAEKGVEITPAFLKEKGIIKSAKRPVKIVATGEPKKAVVIKDCIASKKAVELIEKVGGKLTY